MKLLLAALVLSTATLAPASALAIDNAAVPAADDARRLAALMLPGDALVRITARVFDNHLQSEAGLSPEKKALYAANPGLKAHLAERMKGEIAAIMRKDLPGLHAELAALFAREMTAEEIGQTLAFLESATGQKMMAQMYSGVAASSATSEEEAKQAAMAGVMGSLTQEDYPALMAFGTTSAAAKLQAVTPKLHEVTKSWATKMIASNEARLTAVRDRATAEYLAKKK